MFNPLKSELGKMRIILATGSKQRHEILSQTGLKFEVIISNYEENLDINQYSFPEYVKATAKGKVLAVANSLEQKGEKPEIIIGLDTMVSCEGTLFGKPKTKEDAYDTIQCLTTSGRPNEVLTGVCIKYNDTYKLFTESTSVFMRKLTKDQIWGYVDTGEPMGHAGSYAIQGIAASFVERIDGDFYNVIGLPLCAICKALDELILNDKN